MFLTSNLRKEKVCGRIHKTRHFPVNIRKTASGS